MKRQFKIFLAQPFRQLAALNPRPVVPAVILLLLFAACSEPYQCSNTQHSESTNNDLTGSWKVADHWGIIGGQFPGTNTYTVQLIREDRNKYNIISMQGCIPDSLFVLVLDTLTDCLSITGHKLTGNGKLLSDTLIKISYSKKYRGDKRYGDLTLIKTNE